MEDDLDHSDFDNNGWPLQSLDLVDQILRAGRRPLLHLVVLYASNTRVMEYAESANAMFLENGLDVYSQINPCSKTEPSKSRDIESHHLAEIIISTKADYLFVTGDRNLKNGTVHCKRRGRLMEMTLGAAVALIWKTWPDPEEWLPRFHSVSTNQLSEILFRLAGIRCLFDRYAYISGLTDDLTHWVKTNGEATINDIQLHRIEQVQLLSIRLNQQLHQGRRILRGLPLSKDRRRKPTGSVQSRNYHPNAMRCAEISILPEVRRVLMETIDRHINLLQENMDIVVKHGNRVPLWFHYKQLLERDSDHASSYEFAEDQVELIEFNEQLERPHRTVDQLEILDSTTLPALPQFLPLLPIKPNVLPPPPPPMTHVTSRAATSKMSYSQNVDPLDHWINDNLLTEILPHEREAFSMIEKAWLGEGDQFQ